MVVEVFDLLISYSGNTTAANAQAPCVATASAAGFFDQVYPEYSRNGLWSD